MKILRFIILLLLTLNLYGEKTVYTFAKYESDTIRIYMINKNLFDITYRYDATYTDLYPMQELPINQSLKAKSKKLIAKFIKLSGSYTLSNKYSWVMGSVNSIHNNRYRYRLPYKIGTTQTVTQGFNGKFSHKGNSLYAVDFGLKKGTKIFASRAGVVVALKEDGDKSGVNKGFAKYANFVTLRHDDGTYGKYVHLRKDGVNVKIGDIVKRGELLGYSGNTGFTNGPHLHFVVFKAKDYRRRKSIPIKFIGKNGIVVEPIRGKKYTAVR